MSNRKSREVFPLTPEWFDLFDGAGLIVRPYIEGELPTLTGSEAKIVIVDGMEGSTAITKSILLALQGVAPEGVNVAVDLNAVNADTADVILSKMKEIIREINDAPVVSQDESRIVEEYEALRQSGGHLGISEPAYVTLPREAPIFDVPAWQRMNQHPTGFKKGKRGKSKKNLRNGSRK